MLQRAVIAMALSCNPALLIADEPTTALDVTIKAQIMDLLNELRKQLGLTILLITHDMGVVAEMADRIMVMYSGRVAELGDAHRLLLSPQHHYSRALIDTATLSEHAWKTDLPVIAGAAPGLLERPTGCAFRPRCLAATATCEVLPALARAGAHAIACHHPLSARSSA
jgi:oligopeptide/dipeptide ABC transporter ATP-binding protein